MTATPPRTYLKEAALRELGDAGADTLARYWAQIEYTAFWCVRMLLPPPDICGVIPEGGEDLVLEFPDHVDLRQIKTRDESQGAWTVADILPILCAQYHRASAFHLPCTFTFVSDGAADTRTALGTRTYGPLFRLKLLLELVRDGHVLSVPERAELTALVNKLSTRVGDLFVTAGIRRPSRRQVDKLLRSTTIETNDVVLRSPNNLTLLDRALAQCRPGHPDLSVSELAACYDRLLLLIVRRIVTGRSRDARRITRADVLQCADAVPRGRTRLPVLSALPGRTTLDKKALLAGFDSESLPTLHRQRMLAVATLRELSALGLDASLARLGTALLDAHMHARQSLTSERPTGRPFGPVLLSKVRVLVGPLAMRYLPTVRDADEQLCLGMLWDETMQCNAWWHRPPRAPRVSSRNGR